MVRCFVALMLDETTYGELNQFFAVIMRFKMFEMFRVSL